MHTKLSIRPQMNCSPQLVISGKLLQVPGSELEKFINTELANNPALESALIKSKKQPVKISCPPASSSGSFLTVGANRYQSFEDIVENIAQRRSPIEKLVDQISMTPDQTDCEIALELLYRLDHRGYLVIPTEKLACELGISRETIMRAIQKLHQLEPPGIGARDIRECFLIQCTHLEAEGTDCQKVRRILTLAWDEFLNQQWDRVARKIQEPKGVVKELCEFMRLNFCSDPLAILETSNETSESLNHADLIVLRDNHANPPTYSLEVPGEEDFELRMSASFQKILGSATQDEYGLSAQEKSWIRNHLDSALIVINALRQRWETLRRLGEYLIRYQNDFLEHGLLYLRPLTRAAVARELNVHESTISRAVSDKIIQLPNGRLIPLSDFFDPSLAAKEAIRLLLKDNPRHLHDHEIAEGLQARGMNLSRRTITKYRHVINLDSRRRQSIGL